MNRCQIAGYLILAMILLALPGRETALSMQFAYAASGVCAMLAAGLLFKDLRLSARLQVSGLFGIGIALLMYAYHHGTSFSLVDAISRNTLLLSMILSVGFLRLLLDLEPQGSVLPRGPRAFLNTLVSLGLFGSVINISAPIMICDRIAREQPVDLFLARAATRVFCICSCWSPYFAGAALILTYVHGVRFVEVIVTGLPLLLLTIISVYYLSLRYDRQRVENFAGYPMSVTKLWLPIVLTACVLSSQLIAPQLSILTVIAVSAMCLTSAVLLIRLGIAATGKALSNHIATALPRSANELLLFLSAGVLATGLTAFVETSGFQLELSHYSLPLACLTLAGMIVAAACGIHPVIQISAITPLLLPIKPDPELLAMTYLFAWALGTASSPLSGTHLIFQARYGIPAWRGALQNWPFVAVAYFVAIALMGLHTVIFP